MAVREDECKYSCGLLPIKNLSLSLSSVNLLDGGGRRSQGWGGVVGGFEYGLMLLFIDYGQKKKKEKKKRSS